MSLTVCGKGACQLCSLLTELMYLLLCRKLSAAT